MRWKNDISDSSIVLDYGLDDWEFVSREGLGIFLSTTASRPALRSTQHPVQWVSGTRANQNYVPNKVKDRLNSGDFC